MTINQVIVDIILFALTTLFTWLAKCYIVPFLKEQHLDQIACIVVKAAEAIYGAGNGEVKMEYCLEQIENKYNIKINREQITNAIESAWHDLNMEQIEAGIKTI